MAMDQCPTSVENEGNSNDDSNRKRKRGFRNPETYKVNKIKMARIQGIGYVNYKGTTVNEQTIGSPCSCKMKCFSKMSEQEQKEIFTRAKMFQSKDEQDIYIQSMIESCPVKQRRSRLKPEDDNPSNHCVPRSSSFKFHIMVREEKLHVCKQAFLSLLGVTEKRVRRLQLLLTDQPLDSERQRDKSLFPIDYLETVLNEDPLEDQIR